MFPKYNEATWTEVKQFLNDRGISAQYIDFKNTYWVIAIDGEFKIWCRILKDDQEPSTEQIDFEDNYKANSNKNIKERDDSGREVIRTAATDKGWAYLAHPIEFETSNINSVFSENWKGESRGECSLRFYDDQGAELTTQNDIDSSCVETRLTIKLGHDFDIVSGKLEQHQQPLGNNGKLTDLRLYTLIGIFDQNGVAFDPDGPGTAWSEQVTEFVGGVNLKYFNTNQELQTDGRAGKKLFQIVNDQIPFDQNQMQLILKHEAGFKHELMVILEYFRKP